MTSSSCVRASASAARPAAARPARHCQFSVGTESGQRKRSTSSSTPAPASSQALSTSPRTPLPLLSRASPVPGSGRSSVATRAFFDSRDSNGGGGGGGSNNDRNSNGNSSWGAATAAEGGGGAGDDNGARALLAYSQAVTADDIDFFVRAAPSDVTGAMTETVSGLLGSLACSAVANSSRASSGGAAASSSSKISPRASSSASAATFDVRVRARDSDLGQLLYSTLMTGYLMRNAASRLRLRSRLSAGGGGGGGVSEGGNGSALPAVLPPPPPTTEATPPPPLASLPSLPSPSPSSATVNPTTLPPEARAAALASLEGTPRLAPGAQTSKVEGEVLKWDQSHGLVSVPAGEYIKALEAELASARAAAAAGAKGKEGETAAAAAAVGALSAKNDDGNNNELPAPAPSSPLSNPLLAYLRSADEEALTSLTAEASAGVLEAANAFVQRLMTGGESLSSSSSPQPRVFGAGGFGVVVAGGTKTEGVVREYRASELRHLLLFVMVVGFMLRTLEARLDIEFSMLLPPAEEEEGGGEEEEEEGGGEEEEEEGE